MDLWEAVQPFLEKCLDAMQDASADALPTTQVEPAEGRSTHSSIQAQAGGDDAGPSRQGSGIKVNASFESSMRNRIACLERDNSPYLLDKAKGEYWAEIKDELNHTSSQREYNILLEFENRDLRIRELKHSCSSCFQQVLLRHPTLADQAPYHPQEVFDDYLDERREALDRLAEEPVGPRPRGQGVPVEERDRREIAFLEDLLSDLQEKEIAAVIQPIFGQSPTISRNND
ncbi:uncharacterized mitochondrial protein AtMg01280-like [Prosopis cineraria]|uniref:uncharacterized mitochondrial protein AtMg01280-like n=1 Tax=Prosopis cineraria TaxID=364024 RepID=UPI0024106E69|nr:uncharacterized mitochondrial protein AtMg01280-like [Prosopis cineraria]